MKSLLTSRIGATFAILGAAHAQLEIKHTAPAGQGKAAQAQLDAGNAQPAYNHVSRQVKRREQRKHLKRMGLL